MSRTTKQMPYRYPYRFKGLRHKRPVSYRYWSKHLTWPKRNGNKRMRQEVNQQLKDLLFTDAFDEKEIRGRKHQIFDRWYYD